MFDFQLFFRYIRRFAWLIVLVPIVGVAATYFFVRDLPNTYKSVAQVSALSSTTSSAAASIRNFQLTAYIAELAKSKRLMNSLSYRLILHDLEDEEEAFREWSDELKSLSDAERSEAMQAYKERMQQHTLLSVADNSGKFKLFDMVNSMGYGESKLLDGLRTSMNDITGIVDITFVSESPDLSVYAVNTLASDLIYYFNSLTETRMDNSLAVLDSVLQDKYRIMNEKKDVLNRYKAGTGVVSAGAQTSALYARVTSYEQKRAETLRQIEALKGAIKSIDDRLNNAASQQTPAVSSDLLVLDQQLKLANQRYVDGGFKATDKRYVDSLQRIRSTMVSASTQLAGGANTRQTRDALTTQRRSLETELALAESGMASIENELADLRGRFNAMMPTDANVQRYEQEFQIANNEYLDALARYNAATTSNVSGMRLSMMDYGLPGLPESPKKFIYLGASGVASLGLCFSVLVLLFFTDRRVTVPLQLESVTDRAVIGELNAIRDQQVDIGEVWKNEGGRADFTLFKNRLRALRFEVGRQLDSNQEKVLLVTSLNTGDGKTFLSCGLAYAFAMTGKRVLLISKTTSSELPIELQQTKSIPQNFDTFLKNQEIEPRDLITLLQVKGGDQSLVEVTDLENLEKAFGVLKTAFDLIIIDGTEMHDANQIREWLSFSDRSLGVFRNGVSMKDGDISVVQQIQQRSEFMGWVFNGVK